MRGNSDPGGRAGNPEQILAHIPQIKSVSPALRAKHTHLVWPLCKENFLSTILLNLKFFLMKKKAVQEITKEKWLNMQTPRVNISKGNY